MKSVKVVLAASTFLGASLIGMALSVSSNVGSIISSAHAGSLSFDQQVVAREASEGKRGFDNERPGDKHRGRVKAIEQFDQLAREASEGKRGFDNERPGDKHRGRGVKAYEEFDQLAREAGEGKRGFDNERPGDKHRGRVKAIEQFDQLAREASEGPRGFDNERPGDRHRGRRGKAIEHVEQVA